MTSWSFSVFPRIRANAAGAKKRRNLRKNRRIDETPRSLPTTLTLLHCICQSYLAFEGRILLFDIGASTMRREHSMTHPTSLPASPSSARPEHSRYFFHGIASHRHCKPLHHSRQVQCLDCGSRRSVLGLRKYGTDPGKAARLLHCSLAYSKCDVGTKAITSLTSIRHPS